MPTTTPQILTTHVFWQALVDAGIFNADEAGMVRRIVIDINGDEPAVIMYVERYASERMLQVVQTLEGVEIREVDRERPQPQSS